MSGKTRVISGAGGKSKSILGTLTLGKGSPTAITGRAGSLSSGTGILGKLGRLNDGIGIGGITGKAKLGSEGSLGSSGSAGGVNPPPSPPPGKLGSFRVGNAILGSESEGRLGRLKEGTGMGGITGRLNPGKEGSGGNGGRLGSVMPPPSPPPGKLGSFSVGNAILGSESDGRLGRLNDGIGMGGMMGRNGIGSLTSTCLATLSLYLMIVVTTRDAIRSRWLQPLRG
jgi:hypothetical protein